ncbi:MAG TPA: glycine-rich domain-containing protein-like [Burkholderiales bacterium]|nr:glycine-rich domain-containing protein-like [Burkholderiales bacterium]
MQRVTDRPVEEVVAAIQALDLDPIKFKLMDSEEGEGWSRRYAEQMELAYKRFLTLLVTHPEETLAPSKDIDKFWHGHILDTLKYAEDCGKVFGYFLHHFPYFGMRGGEDAVNLARAAESTRGLLQQEFGKTGAAYCGAVKAHEAAYCGAIKAENAAYCGAVKADEAAYCGAIKAETPAYCGVARGDSPARGKDASPSERLNVSVRPGF